MIRSLKGLYHLLVAVFANIWFGFPSRQLTVVGVTGTDGKTTTATIIYEILKAAGLKTSMITSVHAVIAGKSYDTGFHVTTPNAWWVQKYLREAVDHGDTHFVLEVTSHGLDQHRVFGVRFAVGVLTNITHEHLDWHGTFENYKNTKLKLLKMAKIAIVNNDEEISYRGAQITYGIRRNAMVTPETFPFKTQLPGEFNRYNCLAAIAGAKALDIDEKIIKNTIRKFTGLVGRMEIVTQKPFTPHQSGAGFTVIVDFAHTPNALENVLKTVRPMAKKRLIHVFGAAGLRDRSKRPLMGAASGNFADSIVLTEEDYRTENVSDIMAQIASGIPSGKTVHSIPNRKDAIAFALHAAKPGDIVIITGKGHEKSLARGTREYPWSDQKAVKDLLRI